MLVVAKDLQTQYEKALDSASISRELRPQRSLERSCLVGILKNKIVDYYRKLGQAWMQASFLRAGQ